MNGILSSIPQENLVFRPRTVNGQLRPGERVIAAGAVTRLTLPSPRGSRPIEILNNTGAEVVISATLGATISGTDTTGFSFSGLSFARLPSKGRAIFTSVGSAWDAVGCRLLSFSYNGTPLSTNANNPLSASGIIHYTGIVQGGGTFTNPAGTSSLTAAITSLDAGSAGVANMTNRVASGENVITGNFNNGWMGWRFALPVRISSFIFQTRSPNSNHPRNFQVRVGDTTSLSSGSDVSGLAIVQSFANQTQVNAANTYYGPFVIDAPIWGNTVIWQINGFDSSGSFYFLGGQEIEFFGAIDA